MRLRTLFILVGLFPLWPAPLCAANDRPVLVILDTDMGNDVDDALALAMLHAFETRGDAHILAVTVSKGNPWAAEYVRLENEFYGRGEIPVGLVRDGKTPDDGKFVRAVCEKHGRTPDKIWPDAVDLLQTTLQAQPDHSVVLFQIGFSTNLARLLDSPGGLELAKRKVLRLYVMAGNFRRPQPEYNVVTDIPAARKVFRDWPTEIVFSGFEIGEAVLFPAQSILEDFAANNPVSEAYKLYEKMPYDRPTWDLTAVLAGLRGDRGYFAQSTTGDVAVQDNGNTTFEPNTHGKRTYLTIPDGGVARIREALVWSSSEPE